MAYISRVKLRNFKRFESLDISLREELNIFVGDNEAGKSTILQAIDLVLSGSKSKVEQYGLEHLFNKDAVIQFMTSANRSFEKLPHLTIELYIEDLDDFNFEGENHLDDRTESCGIRLRCFPNDEDSEIISQILLDNNNPFPFEFYRIDFSTFAGQSYKTYKKPINYLFIDNSTIDNEYAMKEFIKGVYCSIVDEKNRLINKNSFRSAKDNFTTEVLAKFPIDDSIVFSVRNSIKSNLETDLTILYNNIPVEDKGKGIQSIIKTQIALNKATKTIDAVLLEEPENHLSHTNMLNLIDLIQSTSDKQMFVTTHSNMIATRLGLNNLIFLNSSSKSTLSLSGIDKETSNFFVKAPNNNLLQFILSQKVILVEGDAEYILIEKLFEIVTNSTLNENGVHVIAVGGVRFNRYMKIAKALNIKTAVITDNDKDYTKNITNRYSEDITDNIRVFSDSDNSKYTFEVCIYEDNMDLCNNIFSGKELPKYMTTRNNKSDVAYKLVLSDKPLNAPNYIKEAIEWIIA